MAIATITISGIKEGCVFRMVDVPILPHPESGPNDQPEEAPNFTKNEFEGIKCKIK